MGRYLELQGEGAQEWLSTPPTTPAQRVYTQLLQRPESVALDPPRLAAEFGLSLPEFSKALFELSRNRSLTVSLEQSDHSADFRYDFALLCADLQDLAADTAQIMIVTDDGLCLAQYGLTEDVCMDQAAVCHQGANARFPCVVPLFLGQHKLQLCAPKEVHTSGNAMLRLARRFTSLSI